MTSRSPLAAQLLRVGPPAGAHRVALRASVSVLVPLLVLWALGRQELSIYAAFGAFTSLYGRAHGSLSRARMQVTLGLLLTASVTLGTVVGMSPHRAWLAIPVAALVAGFGSLVSDAQEWHPPGPLFLVFSFAACASLSTDGRDVALSALVAGTSAAFALLVGGSGGLLRRWRRPTPDPAHQAAPSVVRRGGAPARGPQRVRGAGGRAGRHRLRHRAPLLGDGLGRRTLAARTSCPRSSAACTGSSVRRWAWSSRPPCSRSGSATSR